MKKLCVLISVVLLLAVNSTSFGDTFKNRQTQKVLHGYATSHILNGKTIVRTQEANEIALNLGEYEITPDALGRNNKVVVISIDGGIELEHTTKALERALPMAADSGPLFILIELDTPGGRIDLAHRISDAISKTNYCRVICFVNGGKYGGAISAGVAVALACDKLYMADNTVLGGATVIVIGDDGPKDMKKVYGDTVGEKFSSIWRANLASLAEHNNRSGILARAMVDKNIGVIEVADANGAKQFISPSDKKPGQSLVKTWNARNTLLTLTAAEAVKSGMADKIVASRQELLGDLKAQSADVVVNDSFQQAGQEFKRAENGIKQLRQSIDLKIKYLQSDQQLSAALKYMRAIRTDFQSAIALAKKYPDLHMNVEKLQEELNSVQAVYENTAKKAR